MKSRGCRSSTFALTMMASFCGTGMLSAQPLSDMGEWTPEFNWGNGGGIEAIHTALLPTGKVMFWQTWTESVGLWDPNTGQFSAAALPSINIFCAGHAWLPDGRLMVVGGHIENYVGEPISDIYDPFTNTWAGNVPDMNAGRWYPSATTLGNGDILVTSGDVFQQGRTNPLSQVYDVDTNSWHDLDGAIREINDLLPEYPRIFQAPDGRAISLTDSQNDTEFLDMRGTGSWEYLEDTLDSNLANYGPSVMYDAGQIAYLGGGHNPTRNISMLDLTVDDPSWRYAGGGIEEPDPDSPFVMAQPRRQNDATILADGTILITGGTSITGWNDPNGIVAATEIWDPRTEQVTQVATAAENIYRGYHSTATLLTDGRVLITGGDHDHNGSGPFVSNRNAEIYSPPYLYNEDGTIADRPEITGAPESVEHGETFFVETHDANDIADALFIVPGATTHSQNWTQRANHLEFVRVDGGLEISLTTNPNDAPPGYYMLFLVDENGVPSVAKWVRAELSTALPGDYSRDGTVNAGDYTVWRDTRGETGTVLWADGSGPYDSPDGRVDAFDYDLWKASFGATSLAVGAAVPEPTAATLLIALSLFATCRIRCVL